jgi:flagellar basal-body rod protein FlgG
MFRSLNIAATGMAAQETQLEAISNNIANGSTVGYKKQRVDFEDLLYQTVREGGAPTGPTTQAPAGLQLGTGVRIVATARDFGEGTMQNTKNPLDVAIEGNGFLAVQQNDGTLAYTRDGELGTDSTGRIVNADGLPIDPGITIPQGATGVTISANGQVSVTLPGQTTQTELGQITLSTFINPPGLTAIGHNLFTPTAGSGEPQVGEAGVDGRGTILQGSLEQSNVDIVEEMVGMISAQRGYEINSKVITTADDMLRAATQMST